MLQSSSFSSGSGYVDEVASDELGGEYYRNQVLLRWKLDKVRCSVSPFLQDINPSISRY
jgi:hypothetical protein